MMDYLMDNMKAKVDFMIAFLEFDDLIYIATEQFTEADEGSCAPLFMGTPPPLPLNKNA